MEKTRSKTLAPGVIAFFIAMAIFFTSNIAQAVDFEFRLPVGSVPVAGMKIIDSGDTTNGPLIAFSVDTSALKGSPESRAIEALVSTFESASTTYADAKKHEYQLPKMDFDPNFLYKLGETDLNFAIELAKQVITIGLNRQLQAAKISKNAQAIAEIEAEMAELNASVGGLEKTVYNVDSQIAIFIKGAGNAATMYRLNATEENNSWNGILFAVYDPAIKDGIHWDESSKIVAVMSGPERGMSFNYGARLNGLVSGGLAKKLVNQKVTINGVETSGDVLIVNLNWSDSTKAGGK